MRETGRVLELEESARPGTRRRWWLAPEARSCGAWLCGGQILALPPHPRHCSSVSRDARTARSQDALAILQGITYSSMHVERRRHKIFNHNFRC